VASLADVRTFVSGLPEVTEGERHGNVTWFVRGKAFAWKRFGDDPVPDGPILALRTSDLEDKEAVLATGTKGFFTIAHFDGFAAVLVQLDKVTKRPLRSAIEDAWLACAPDALAADYLATRQPGARR